MPSLLFFRRRLPTTRRRGREHELHQLERGGLRGDTDASAAQEEAPAEPHVLHAGADRGAGKRCNKQSIINDGWGG